jgi:hypothetical protein
VKNSSALGNISTMAYTVQDMRQAVENVLNGQKIVDVSAIFKIPYGTLQRKVGKARKGQSIENKRRGPAPILPLEIECDLVYGALTFLDRIWAINDKAATLSA